MWSCNLKPTPSVLEKREESRDSRGQFLTTKGIDSLPRSLERDGSLSLQVREADRLALGRERKAYGRWESVRKGGSAGIVKLRFSKFFVCRGSSDGKGRGVRAKTVYKCEDIVPMPLCDGNGSHFKIGR